MAELLAPAGNYESFIAAISNGCNAIYLGLDKFGARAYAKNFNYDELKDLIEYAHLRNVKIYVTMNTIVYENELEDAYRQIDTLYYLGVDGVIIQDLALIDYLTKKYPLMEAHASTQMGIDDINGVDFCTSLGIKRVVLARETPISVIKDIKNNRQIELEVFVHGALCVSYSGNCLISGLLGDRSGNRGKCVGSCRKKYKLINQTEDKLISDSYILSMKDLNTTSYIKDLKYIDSLKIEGRMKEPAYVANVVKAYRDLLDNKASSLEIQNNLLKTFNRTFTKGYLFNEDRKDIVNPVRPNNVGYLIGQVSKIFPNKYQITLNDTLNQGDQIRIVNSNLELNLPINKMYDKAGNYINSSSDIVYIELKEKLTLDTKIYKTKDIKYNETLEKSYPFEYKRLPLNFILKGNINEKLVLTINYENINEDIVSDYIISESITKKISFNEVFNQLDRLNTTPYYLNNLELNISENSFIPSKVINNLRRDAIIKLNDIRLKKRNIVDNDYSIKKINFKETENKTLAVYCTTKEQYQACIEESIEVIYYDKNVFKRNNQNYYETSSYVLVGGYSGIEYFKNKGNIIISDSCFNVVNSKSVNILHNQNVSRVTLSHELNKDQINDLIEGYKKDNDGYPNLELIIYGHQELMNMNYCPLKSSNLCGQCKKSNFILKDAYEDFHILNDNNCQTTILNGKILNLIDDIDSIEHINTYRLQFTIEDYEDTKKVINQAKMKLNNKLDYKVFDSKIHTKSQYNKESL